MNLDDIPQENDLRRIVYNLYAYKKLRVVEGKIFLTNSRSRRPKEVILSQEEAEFIKDVIKEYEDDENCGLQTFGRYLQEIEECQ